MMIGVTAFLEVATLGRFEVRRQQQLLTGGNWSRRKVNDLFKLLLSAEQHRLHREQIQDILWPNSSIEQATNSFGKTLYLLRRALEPDLPAGKGASSVYVLLDQDSLMLVPDSMSIDADIFESTAKQLQARMRSRAGKEQAEDALLLEEFDRVLALYKGDYLPEDLYEDWSQRRRDRLRRVHSWLLENAAELAVASKNGQRAVEYLQALLEPNSADEQTHRQLMLVYARMGRRSDALNQYLLLRKALREDLHASPLAETNELLRRIQMGRIPIDLEVSWQTNDQSPGLIRPLSSGTASAEKSQVPLEAGGAELKIGQIVQEKAEPSADQSLEPEAETSAQLDLEHILQAELVGREEEISRLQRAYSLARKGQQRVLFISGEPGIGKTRLAREFAYWSEETQQALVLWGYCYEMNGSLPYQPIADAISAHVRTCSPERLRQLLGNSAGDLAKIAPEVRFKLPELPQPEQPGPETERRNLYNAVAYYFNALAAERPLILILDDLQWADAATMQLLNFLTLQSAGESVRGTGPGPFNDASPPKQGTPVPLYLGCYRTGEVHEPHPLRGLLAALTRAGISEELRLLRLSEEQVQELLMKMAGQYVSPTFAAEIYRHTEGNPFFIGEAIRSLILEGKIKWTGERWQATVKASELEIPQSVRLLIERRLIHLSPDCRATLTLAAVLGRHFSSALLCQARNLLEEVVAEHIDDAIAAQLLSPLPNASKSNAVTQSQGIADLVDRNGQEVDLTFTHDMIREVLYQWLNPLRRRTLHRQVAQAIESRYASHLQPYYSRLAYHYQMAEDPARAVDYLLKAANLARSVYAFVDAAEYLKTALDLLIGDAERRRRAELLAQLSDIYLYTGRPDEAIKAGLASCTLWRDLGEFAKEAEARLNVSFCCHWMGREADAMEHIQAALDCLKTKPDETYLFAKAYAQWGLAATVIGDVPLARARLEKADELHTQVGGNDPFISIVSLWARSWCALLAQSPQQMLDYALQGAEVCHTLNRPEWEPMMTYSAAWAHMLMGQLVEGEQAAQNAIAKAQQHGVVGALGWAYLALAFIAIQAGRWDEAKQSADSAYAIATMLHDADLQGRVLWSRSVCAGWQGDWEQAIFAILEAIQLAEQEGQTSLVFPYLLIQAAKSHFYAGKLEKAQIYLDQGMQLALRHEYRQLPAICWRIQGRIWQGQGRFEEAQPCFERSLTELEPLDDKVEYARTEEAYGLFYLARNKEGDLERGHALINSAHTTFKQLGVNG